MFKNTLTLQKAARLTCSWVRTGDPQRPLACVWADAKVRTSSKAASSPKDESGRMPLCA